MRNFHLEIDERRQSGDLKGALDLARYAHAQLSQHQLIKRSYAWALYSYIKYKIINNLNELSSTALPHHDQHTTSSSPPHLLSDLPRRREINLLCREYRRHKLLTADLCFSLILHQLCRISPAPLGLYGLLNWAGISGLRDEDTLVNPDHPERPPLIFTLAIHLSSLVNCLDQERVAGLTPRIAPSKVATLAARLCDHLIQITPLSCTDQPPWSIPSIWGACWLSRRAAQFQQSLIWADLLMHAGRSTPELWWEVAQSLAEEEYIPLLLTHQGKLTTQLDSSLSSHSEHITSREVQTQTRQDRLKDALACALRSTYEARSRGISEIDLTEIYARAGYWSGLLRNYPLAQSLLWWSIEVRQRADVPSPYIWTELLIQYGGSHSEPWTQLSAALNKALHHTASLNRFIHTQKNDSLSLPENEID